MMVLPEEASTEFPESGVWRAPRSAHPNSLETEAVPRLALGPSPRGSSSVSFVTQPPSREKQGSFTVALSSGSCRQTVKAKDGGGRNCRFAADSEVVGDLGAHYLLASEMRGCHRVGLSPSPAPALAGVGTKLWDVQLGSWRPARCWGKHPSRPESDMPCGERRGNTEFFLQIPSPSSCFTVFS